ncbi:MAG: hypothetical protein COA43_14655 [Robiginitomaculum sp.]|nr:MAG: hypothetical protein COA43_14655 [Robiginitomaculum sp.]
MHRAGVFASHLFMSLDGNYWRNTNERINGEKMLGAKMKYVVFDGYKGEQIIIFPKIIQHSVMADNVKDSSFGGMRPISGGFVVNGVCVGESESLRMKSRGDEDTHLIAKLLDLDIEEEIKLSDTRKPITEVQNKNKAKRDRKKLRK